MRPDKDGNPVLQRADALDEADIAVEDQPTGAQTPPHRCLRRPRRRAVAPALTSSSVRVSLNDANTARLIAAFDSGVTSLPASR